MPGDTQVVRQPGRQCFPGAEDRCGSSA